MADKDTPTTPPQLPRGITIPHTPPRGTRHRTRQPSEGHPLIDAQENHIPSPLPVRRSLFFRGTTTVPLLTSEEEEAFGVPPMLTPQSIMAILTSPPEEAASEDRSFSQERFGGEPGDEQAAAALRRSPRMHDLRDPEPVGVFVRWNGVIVQSITQEEEAGFQAQLDAVENAPRLRTASGRLGVRRR